MWLQNADQLNMRQIIWIRTMNSLDKSFNLLYFVSFIHIFTYWAAISFFKMRRRFYLFLETRLHVYRSLDTVSDKSGSLSIWFSDCKKRRQIYSLADADQRQWRSVAMSKRSYHTTVHIHAWKLVSWWNQINTSISSNNLNYFVDPRLVRNIYVPKLWF